MQTIFLTLLLTFVIVCTVYGALTSTPQPRKPPSSKPFNISNSSTKTAIIIILKAFKII